MSKSLQIVGTCIREDSRRTNIGNEYRGEQSRKTYTLHNLEQTVYVTYKRNEIVCRGVYRTIIGCDTLTF